jgi:hypothetical protein
MCLHSLPELLKGILLIFESFIMLHVCEVEALVCGVSSRRHVSAQAQRKFLHADEIHYHKPYFVQDLHGPDETFSISFCMVRGSAY